MKATAEGYAKIAGLKDYLNTKKDGKKVLVFVKSGTSIDHIKELLMCIEIPKDNETIVMSLIGDFYILSYLILS